jgi:hypothetical protein
LILRNKYLINYLFPPLGGLELGAEPLLLNPPLLPPALLFTEGAVLEFELLDLF